MRTRGGEETQKFCVTCALLRLCRQLTKPWQCHSWRRFCFVWLKILPVSRLILQLPFSPGNIGTYRKTHNKTCSMSDTVLVYVNGFEIRSGERFTTLSEHFSTSGKERKGRRHCGYFFSLSEERTEIYYRRSLFLRLAARNALQWTCYTYENQFLNESI